MKLSELVRGEGYGFVVDRDTAWSGRKILGDPSNPQTFGAVMCEDDQGQPYIACRADSLDHVYNVTHEIAEHQLGHKHTSRLFAWQAQITARWVREINERKAPCHCA